MRKDVSGPRFGLRCEGDMGCDLEENPSGIESMELHFGDVHHYTFYKNDPHKNQDKAPNDGYWLYTTGETRHIGYCFPLSNDAYNCEHEDESGMIIGSRGESKIRCITKDVVSDDINSQKLQSMADVYPYPDDDPKKDWRDKVDDYETDTKE